MPVISVLMSTYNEEKYVKETINSILNQTYQDFEFIIVDDGSTDATIEVIESFNDSRIKLYKLEKNMGVGYALNYGLEKCTGKYMAKADADDLYHPERLELQKDFLDNNPDVTLVKSLVEYFPDNDEVERSPRYKVKKTLGEKRFNEITKRDDIKEKLYWYCCIPHTVIMIRLKVAQEYSYKYYKIGEDYDLFYRLNKAGFIMETVYEKLAKIRLSNLSVSATHIEMYRENLYKIKRNEILELVKEEVPLYIWGAGSFGRRVSTILSENNIEIDGFIDGDQAKIGQQLNNIKIFGDDVIKKNHCKIIVASEPGLIDIVAKLKGLGLVHLEDYLVYS